MVGDRAVAAEQTARCATGGRPTGAERHLLAAADGFALVGDPGALRTVYHLLQPLRPVAEGGVWDRLFTAVSSAYAGEVQMVDSSSIRVHQHAANGKKGVRTPPLGTDLTADAWGARAEG